PELIAAKGIGDDPVAIEAQGGQLLAELADDGAKGDRPRGRRQLWPEQFRQLGLRYRTLPLRHQIDERQPALTARKIAFPKELLAPFGRHFAREIDPQHGIAKHSPNASSDDLRHPGRSFEEVRNAKARRVRVRLGPADR